MGVAVGRRLSIRPECFGDEGADFGVPGTGEIELSLRPLFTQKVVLHRGINSGDNLHP